MLNRFVFIALLTPVWVFAADSPLVSADPINPAYMVKLLLSLSVVVGLIFALAWMVKKYNVMPSLNGGPIKILSSLALNSRDRIALLEVGEEQILVSISPGKISKIHELKIPLKQSELDINVTPFAQKFGNILKKQQQKQQSHETV